MPNRVDIKHFGKIVRGRKVYDNPELYLAAIRSLEGKEFEEVIKQRSNKTTLDQYAYYRGAILPTCLNSEMFASCDKSDDVHEYFADKFLSYTVMVPLPNGKKKEEKRVRSMSDMNRKETSEFIRRVLIECDMLGIIVLRPEEYQNKLYKK